MGKCLGIWIVPSSFSAWQRPPCVIGGCLRATMVVGAVRIPAGEAEDLIGAERRPNIRKNSSIFRYWVEVQILHIGL